MYPVTKQPSILVRAALVAMNRNPLPDTPSAAPDTATTSPNTGEPIPALEKQPGSGDGSDDASSLESLDSSATASSLDEGEGEGHNNDDDYFSCTIHGAALERRLQARLDKMSSRLIDDAVAFILPRLDEAADAAVARRLAMVSSFEAAQPQQQGNENSDYMTAIAEEDRHVADAVRALATLEAADPALSLAERVFVRRGVVALLRRLVGRLEGELEDLEWEQL